MAFRLFVDKGILPQDYYALPAGAKRLLRIFYHLEREERRQAAYERKHR